MHAHQSVVDLPDTDDDDDVICLGDRSQSGDSNAHRQPPGVCSAGTVEA